MTSLPRRAGTSTARGFAPTCWLKTRSSAVTKRYECEFYSIEVPEKSCLFCEHCTDVFWDYTNGPYMLVCDVGADTASGARGECAAFIEEEK